MEKTKLQNNLSINGQHNAIAITVVIVVITVGVVNTVIELPSNTSTTSPIVVVDT